MATICRQCCTPIAGDPTPSRCPACGSPRLLAHPELDRLAIALEAEPVSLEDLPEALVRRWVTPDGRALVISATVNLDDSAHAETLYHLFRIADSGGEPEALTGGDEWSCHTAKSSADGNSLYCLLEPVTSYAYNLTEIARFDWPKSGEAGAKITRRGGLGRSPGHGVSPRVLRQTRLRRRIAVHRPTTAATARGPRSA